MELPTLDRSVSGASTLPSSCYRDKAWLPRERVKVFHRTWQYAGHAAWAPSPGDRFPVDLHGEPLAIVRGLDGRLTALSNVCRHRAGPLVTERACGKTLQCRYHGWTYDLGGAMRGGPELEGMEGFDPRDVRLPSFRAATLGPLVLVALSEETAPFSDYFGEMTRAVEQRGLALDSFRFAYRRDYVVRCNWKTYIDNYLEGYHIPFVHPALFRELDYASYRVDTHRYYSHQYAPVRSSGNASDRRYEEGKEALYYWVFPNLILNFYPDNLSLNFIVPLDDESTLTVFEWFVPAGSPLERPGGAPFFPVTTPLPDEEPSSAAVADLVGFSHQVQLEDIAICEAVQRGLASKTYDRGRYNAKRENGVHHFHRLWLEFLEG